MNVFIFYLLYFAFFLCIGFASLNLGVFRKKKKDDVINDE